MKYWQIWSFLCQCICHYLNRWERENWKQTFTQKMTIEWAGDKNLTRNWNSDYLQLFVMRILIVINRDLNYFLQVKKNVLFRSPKLLNWIMGPAKWIPKNVSMKIYFKIPKNPNSNSTATHFLIMTHQLRNIRVESLLLYYLQKWKKKLSPCWLSRIWFRAQQQVHILAVIGGGGSWEKIASCIQKKATKSDHRGTKCHPIPYMALHLTFIRLAELSTCSQD